MNPPHVLVTGGARSGKSRFAEKLAAESAAPVVYVATAAPLDEEMRRRIAAHRERRPPEWETVEEPLDLAGVLRRSRAGTTVLIDCLTLYVSNWLFAHEGEDPAAREALFGATLHDLASALRDCPAGVILVAGEVGLGIVPENALARSFRDLAGLANQALAAACDQVYLVVSGIPVRIKG
ncbi:adenosylcobinamide kinase /adenosylcobinamide-phosphate guanylyltransferase [Hydrogenispora ethanolica]|jgi:adenosylcobinamide kinase/adenosylcobinamide-phosphate guanylyltransferase|uniref:Adenosylcobinamide kinase n=1 Tax=Hydrogenispora ethanolica TaxID=1082276 RepID=A0A4V2QG21_HYDET|nr:bifunctional adenosylcobinamide kinase/adenosylcobinamide-phosphate guanylyltransferase [Hydrogenispora ethanolica]TCL74087.1 adenosylcobinamide kinase /adenosylcobinamide-phosphate guanylyltransferase [Hydrogenispora ethanolica]